MKGQAKRTKQSSVGKGQSPNGHRGTTSTRAVTTRAGAAGNNTTSEPAYGYLPSPPRIERRKSSVHGWGVFAQEAIPKNKRIIHYAGEKIPSKESTPREERYLSKGHIWCFKLNNRWVIDAAVGGNVARFINHACRPNCYTEIKNGVIWIRAGRTIRKGEELTYNYYTEGHAEIPCRCRPGCQGML